MTNWLSGNESSIFVSEMARIEMEERFGKDAYTKGYDVFTTINSKLQEAAQSSLKKNIEKYVYQLILENQK